MRPWELLPERQTRAMLQFWSWLPGPLRRALAPLGRLTGPHSVAAGRPGPGVETVPGVAPLLAAGWVPLETLTGMLRVGEVWPGDCRRSVPETRDSWLAYEEPNDSYGLVWLVRSPWPGVSVREALNLLWLAMERDQRDRDFTEAQRFAEMHRLLRLPEGEIRSLT